METGTKNQVRTETLVSGNFSEKGNFSGYNIAGTRYFVNGKRMEALGITKDEDFKKPIFAVVVSKTYNEFDADTNQPKTDAEGNVLTFERDTATAVFATREEANNAMASGGLMAQEQADILKKARQESDDLFAQAKMQSAIKMRAIALEAELSEETLVTLLNAM